MTEMMALRAHHLGGPEVLIVEPAPVPVPAEGEVSGVVADIASGDPDFGPGDEVYGLIPFDRDGAAAEYVTVPGAIWPPGRRLCRTPSPPPYRWPG
jgi:NADPH:quinone reductase-like Zn-dependent oxidoreductase